MSAKKNIRKAKIVATLGPSSNDLETIKKLIMAGMNVARLNMSHGTYEQHAELIKNIREASQSIGIEVAILQDLQGPKIRVAVLDQELELTKGSRWYIGVPELKDQFESNFIPSDYAELVNDCVPNTKLLFDDGKIKARAVEREGDAYLIEITEGGVLKSKKGINLPDCKLSAPSFTPKDQKDLEFGIEQGIDFVALSFVRDKEDIIRIKDFLKQRNSDVLVVAKIEKPQAVLNIQEITEEVDVIMVARGDMGVEVGDHLVPVVQKKLISLCNLKGIPVITATQMLESMIGFSTPTRAEASDVANAIWDGTDAVMLSAESASGKFPIEAVKMMSSIILEAEKYPKKRISLKDLLIDDVGSTMMIAASLIAENIKAHHILCMTTEGNSCRKLSRFRPKIPILGVTNSINVVRRMCLFWGCMPFHLTNFDEDNLDLQKQVVDLVKTEFKLNAGDKVVVTKGEGKFFQGGTSNSVIVEIIP